MIQTGSNSILSNYAHIPHALFSVVDPSGRKLSLGKISTIGLIASLSGGEAARCNLSYRGFSERLRISYPTVTRAISAAKKLDLITQDKSNPSHASYTYNGSNSQKEGYITVYNFLRHISLTDKRGGTVYLTASDVFVFAFIKSNCDPKGRIGQCLASVGGIAKALNLSRKTIQKSITTLLSVKLIFRPKRGINSYERSVFTVHTDLFNKIAGPYLKKPAKKSGKDGRSEAVIAADERADRERYYARIQDRERKRIAHFESILQADKTAKKLMDELRTLPLERAKAEISGDSARAEKLRVKERDLNDKLDRRKIDLHIAEELKPVYLCEACHDTGFRLTDRLPCGCYKPPRRSP